MTNIARTIDILADELDETYGSEADENLRDAVSSFAYGDFNYLAHEMIRDLRDDPYGDGIYASIQELTDAEYTALVITLAQITRTHYKGL